jgi:zinc transport system substrate-binding protein
MKKIGLVYILTFYVFFVGVLSGCKRRVLEQNQSDVAVTNSYLQCIVQDLCGQETQVLCLAPPGMCPGHFDISPSQVQQLEECKLLLLFDFQEKIVDSLSRLQKNGLETVLIKMPGGLCVPETYLAACRQVSEVLSRKYPDKANQYQQMIESIEQRLDRLGQELLNNIKRSDAESAKVLSSDHQARFVQWLGLDTVATFVGSDIETVSNINHCLQKAADKDVQFIIANKQEGSSLARALAERLRARVVVFSNFPENDIGAYGFDRLIQKNVEALLGAAE